MKRREFLQLGLAAALLHRYGSGPVFGKKPGAPEFDLIFKGGRLIDPSQSLDRILDLATAGGKIALIAPEIDGERARRTVEVQGQLVTPGLIDLHGHAFQGVSSPGIDIDRYCIARGVTTAVDAGTSGADSFEGFLRHVVLPSGTRVLAFLNIARTGLISPVPELMDRRVIDSEAALQVTQKHADVIVGLKIRCSRFYSGPNDLEAVIAARSVGEAVGKPLMVHVGWPYSPMEEILKELRPGDIVTHAFRGPGEGGVVGPDGRVSPHIRRAAEKGVLFDIGHGSGSFSFEAAQTALEQGFLPSTISSDIHASSVLGPVFDLLTTMSKMLLLGIPLEKVIELATIAPARALNRGDTLGSLKPGRPADVAVLDLVKGDFTLIDSKKQRRHASRKLVPVLALREGSLLAPPA